MCEVLWPEELPCASRGVCIPENSTCICEGYWLGIGDLMSAPLNCDIHEFAIQILWIPSEFVSAHDSFKADAVAARP